MDPRKYGDLLAPILRLTKVEARMAVRRGRGLFVEDVDRQDAEKIAEELGKDGIRARVVSREEVPPLPRPRKVTHVEYGDDILAYRDETGMAALPWDAILVASFGAVARPECGDYFTQVPFGAVPPLHQLEGPEREIVRENLILKMEAVPRDEAHHTRAVPESIFEEIEQKHADRVRVRLDLVTRDLGTWLRLPLEEAGYVNVAGGVKMGGHWGFQLLAADLRRKCEPALTEIALKLLDAADIRELVFPQIEEFTRYTAWVALKRHLWPDAASWSPSPGPPGPSTDAGSSSASSETGPPSTSS